MSMRSGVLEYSLTQKMIISKKYAIKILVLTCSLSNLILSEKVVACFEQNITQIRTKLEGRKLFIIAYE